MIRVVLFFRAERIKRKEKGRLGSGRRIFLRVAPFIFVSVRSLDLSAFLFPTQLFFGGKHSTDCLPRKRRLEGRWRRRRRSDGSSSNSGDNGAKKSSKGEMGRPPPQPSFRGHRKKEKKKERERERGKEILPRYIYVYL